MTTRGCKIKILQKQVCRLLLCLLLACLFTYAYLVNQVVFDLASRGNLSYERSTLVSELGRLEAEYLELIDQITIEQALALGFEEAGGRSSFLSVSPIVLALNGGNEREN